MLLLEKTFVFSCAQTLDDWKYINSFSYLQDAQMMDLSFDEIFLVDICFPYACVDIMKLSKNKNQVFDISIYIYALFIQNT